VSVEVAAPLLRRPAGRARLRLVGLVRPAAAAAPSRPRRARAALGWFAAGAVLIHLAAALAIDVAWPRLRDPEYGRRAAALRARVEENPGRPLVLVLGSSRAAMGVRPAAWEAARPRGPRDPLLFNAGQVGGGPVTSLLTLRRLHADGFRPALVLVEYWPPFLRQDGEHAEAARFDARRLRPIDLPVVRSYFPDPAGAEAAMRRSRLDVLHANRETLLVQADPAWVGRSGGAERAWAGLDGWGWLPGMDPAPEDDAARRRLTDHQRSQLRPMFRGHSIHPDSGRALRELVAAAGAHGARVAFLVLPEAAEARGDYPPEMERAAREHLAGLSRELGVPVINTRDWMGDEYLADGFHLSRAGAALFTARLGARVAESPGLLEGR
jgi:hypothetical protein